MIEKSFLEKPPDSLTAWGGLTIIKLNTLLTNIAIMMTSAEAQMRVKHNMSDVSFVGYRHVLVNLGEALLDAVEAQPKEEGDDEGQCYQGAGFKMFLHRRSPFRQQNL